MLLALGHAVQLQAVIHQFEAQFFGHAALQLFDILVAEFDHAAGLDIDQMVVMVFRRFFIAGAAIAEIMALQDAGILEQLDGAIDRGDGDMRIDRGGAAIEFLGIGMVARPGQHARDDPALLGHAQALVDAEFFDPRHARSHSR